MYRCSGTDESLDCKIWGWGVPECIRACSKYRFWTNLYVTLAPNGGRSVTFFRRLELFQVERDSAGKLGVTFEIDDVTYTVTLDLGLGSSLSE